MILHTPTRLIRASRRRRAAGFTLVEIMIVILIIGVLLNIAAPAFIHARDNSQSKSCSMNLHNIGMAKEECAIDNKISATDATSFNWKDATHPSYDISSYIKQSSAPTCPTAIPGQSAYNIGPLNTAPICPYGGPTWAPHIYSR